MATFYQERMSKDLAKSLVGNAYKDIEDYYLVTELDRMTVLCHNRETGEEHEIGIADDFIEEDNCIPKFHTDIKPVKISLPEIISYIGLAVLIGFCILIYITIK